MKLTRKQKVNYADFLLSAIKQLKKDDWWISVIKTEYQQENNLEGFSPIMALERIYKNLLGI